MDIDTTNKSMVSSRGDQIVMLMPRQAMSKEEALNLAAWLVAVSMASHEEFMAVLNAVENT